MPFEVTKISEHGTSHPVIARLHLQTFRLLNSYREPLREPVKQVYFHAAFRLIHCYDTHAELLRRQNDAEAEIHPSTDPRITYRPNLVGLNQMVERFLYEAKNFLRDISDIFEPFDGPKFNEAAAFGKKASEWAAATYGDDERVTNHLHRNWPWIDHLIKMRNAIEHPAGYSGTLYIENYAVVGSTLHKPTWHLNDFPPAEISQEMGKFCECLLIFAEELLALLIEKHLPEICQIVEIPGAERNPAMPMRLKIDMKPQIYATHFGKTA